MYNQQLAARYLDILSSLDTALLDKYRPGAGGHGNLSGLFLPSVPRNIQQAPHRVMVVGAETAGWKVLSKDERFTDLSAYVEKAMSRHQYILESGLSREKSRGFTFFNFMRSIADRCGTDGLIYANLFCFDWKGGDQQVCRNSKDYYSQHKITRHHLWEFMLYDSIRCFRIHHPSAFSKKAQQAREFIISLLPAACCRKSISRASRKLIGHTNTSSSPRRRGPRRPHIGLQGYCGEYRVFSAPAHQLTVSLGAAWVPALAGMTK